MRENGKELGCGYVIKAVQEDGRSTETLGIFSSYNQ